MAKIVFVDLETTGFSREWDYIIEVAAILYDEETQKTLGQFHEYIRPAKRLPQKITEITGITEFQLKDCRTEKEVLADFYEWLLIQKPDKVVGHNYKSFDGSFLQAKADRYRLILKEMEIVDTLTLARQLTKAGKLPVDNHKQPTLAAYYGIVYQAHSAIEDVKALIQVYEKMGLNKTKKAVRESLGF
jgi:DNA polymerase III epsilon subunit family exonuclease